MNCEKKKKKRMHEVELEEKNNTWIWSNAWTSLISPKKSWNEVVYQCRFGEPTLVFLFLRIFCMIRMSKSIFSYIKKSWKLSIFNFKIFKIFNNLQNFLEEVREKEFRMRKIRRENEDLVVSLSNLVVSFINSI